MIKLKLFKDTYGSRHVQVEPLSYELVGWYLKQDVQADPRDCKETIQLIEEIQAGKRAYFEGTGNANTLILTREKARIETEFAIPPKVCELSLQDLKQAITEWLAFIESS